MSAKRKAFKVRHGNAHLTVAPWTHPVSGKESWRFAYRPAPGQPLKYQLHPTKAAAELAAELKLETLAAATNTLDELPPDRRRWLEQIHRSVPAADESRVLDFIRAMAASANLAAATTRFTASQTSRAGEETPHLATTRRVLETLAEGFPTHNVADIHLPDLQAWFDRRTAGRGWKRRKDIRATLIQFFRWCRREGIAGTDPVTVAERLPEIGGEHGERQILTLDQFTRLHRAIAEEFRAWLILGSFAGMRPEEIAPGPARKGSKRGILCEEIDWTFKTIRIDAKTSKVGFPRTVPLSAACLDGLEWAGIRPGMTGPVCLNNPSQSKELARLGKLIFGGPWPKDILRHSYGSYRNAIIRNMPQLAEEMGTSIAMLHRHYHNPQPEQTGLQWFSIRPSVLICSDETGGAAPSAASAAS
jgi:integrase